MRFFETENEREDNRIELITMRPIFSLSKQKSKKEKTNWTLDKLLKISDEETLDDGKILCFQLAKGNLETFEKLYKTESPSYVYELLSLELATNYHE